MTREEAIVILDGFKHNPLFNEQHFEALDMAISALSTEPCREADDYENEIADLHNRLDIAEYDKERYKEEITILEAENKGEWFAITQPWADTQIFQCTCCGRHIEVPQYEVSTLTIRYPFCHCGADMRGET